jgi:hypothetical protein
MGIELTITIRTTMRIGITVGTRITIPIGLTLTVGSHYCATITPSHAGSLPPRKTVTADRHRWAHKAFFAHARA